MTSVLNFSSYAKPLVSNRGSVFGRQAFKAQNYGDLKSAIANNDSQGVVKHIRSTEFNRGMDKAYENKSGYSIGYVGGKKVLFVSGSRNITDWTFNVLDNFYQKGPVSSKLGVAANVAHRISTKTVDNLDKIARENNVDIVVGHSRAGKLVDQMPSNRKYKKLAVDGAMIISKGKRDTMNIYAKSGFDHALAFKGKKNFGQRWKRKGNFHWTYRDWKGYQPYQKYRKPVTGKHTRVKRVVRKGLKAYATKIRPYLEG